MGNSTNKESWAISHLYPETISTLNYLSKIFTEPTYTNARTKEEFISTMTSWQDACLKKLQQGDMKPGDYTGVRSKIDLVKYDVERNGLHK